MRVFKQEIRTGVLVIVTVGVLTLVLLLLAAPGVFSPLNTYHIYFDDAGGIKQGGPVLLAGRKIGQVTKLISPVPYADRPANFKQDETIVEVEVTRTADIFREVTVKMEQSSLLGDVVIDFTSGIETSGRAPNGSYFIGDRAKSFAESIGEAVAVLKQEIIPVAQEATKTMMTLRKTSDNLNLLTAPGSNVDKAVNNFRAFGQNLVEMSKPGSPLITSIQSLDASLKNLNVITDDLIKNDRIKLTLANLQKSSENIDKLSERLDHLLVSVGPQFDQVAANAAQFTDTIKRQPWRLIWHSTVGYPGDAPQASPAPKKRKKNQVQ